MFDLNQTEAPTAVQFFVSMICVLKTYKTQKKSSRITQKLQFCYSCNPTVLLFYGHKQHIVFKNKTIN